MDIYLKKAILHIVDRETGEPIVSIRELDLAKEYIRDYLEKKIKKSSSAQTLVGTLEPNSAVGRLLKDGSQSFVEKSQQFVALWYEAYKQSETAPSCDVVFVQFEMDATEYLAFLKIDYMTGYTHFVDSDETGFYSELLLYQALLSPASKKAEESFVVRTDNLEYELVEKKYEFSSEKKVYFSTEVIQSLPCLSFDQTVKVIAKTAEKIGAKFDQSSVQLKADIQEALATSFAKEDTILLDEVAETVFKENITAKLSFKEEVLEQGITDQAPMIREVKELTTKKFGKQKIKLANGIELIVPMDVYRNPDYIEFVPQPDGRLTVVIKDFEGEIEE